MVSSCPLSCSKWSSNILIQPAKRRAAEAATPKARQSKLAKEHNITNEEENEIKEAFALFTEEKKGEKEGVIPIGDVRRAMMYFAPSSALTFDPSLPLCCHFTAQIYWWRILSSALNIPPSTEELEEFISILDPDNEGFALYHSFLAICALKFQHRTRTSDSHAQEVDEAFRLFTRGGNDEKITLATLKRVAQALKEDVDEDVLRDMILEANGGAGVQRGVERDEFEGIMRRAGIWRWLGRMISRVMTLRCDEQGESETLWRGVGTGKSEEITTPGLLLKLWSSGVRRIGQD